MKGKPTVLYLLGKADDQYKSKRFHASQRRHMRRFSMFLCLLLVFVSPVVGSQGPRSTKQEKPEINGQGTPGTLSKFTGNTQIGDSIVAESNGGIQISGNLNVTIDAAPGIAIEGVNNTLQGSTDLDAMCCSAIRGIKGTTFSPAGVAVEAMAVSEVGDPVAVLGFTHSANRGIGVRGQASSSIGNGIGVLGEAASSDGVAVLGNAFPQSGASRGVVGMVSSPEGVAVQGLGGSPSGDPVGVMGLSFITDRGIGVRGQAQTSTGNGIGVLGEANSPNGTAGVFNAIGGGTILTGIANNAANVFRVDINGTVFANGGFQPFGADFAESIAVKGDRSRYEPGDVLAIDRSGQRRLAVADSPYSTFVAGIYSTKPGVLASPYTMENPNFAKEVPMAVVGIVPCKVSAENGAIEAGDLLVASSTPGHAMRGTDRTKMLGAVIGKALEPLQNGKGVIQVLVTSGGYSVHSSPAYLMHF